MSDSCVIHPGIRTMIPAVRISRLTQLCATVPDGCFVECGVWRGGCLAVLASIARTEGKGRRIYGFDSFEGLPEQTAQDKDHGSEFVGSCIATEKGRARDLPDLGGASGRHDPGTPAGSRTRSPAMSAELPPIAVLRPGRRLVRIHHGLPEPPLPQAGAGRRDRH